MTKGEIVAASRDPRHMRALARGTLSCAHPEASRYAKRDQGNCGYCFPCLIRRGIPPPRGARRTRRLAFDALSEDEELVNERGKRPPSPGPVPQQAPQNIDVLRNGPVPDGELHDFADVYRRGRDGDPHLDAREATSATHSRTVPVSVTRYLDTHCHLDLFDDPSKALDAAPDTVVVAVTELPSRFRLLEARFRRDRRVRVALGLHPLRADTAGPIEEGQLIRSCLEPSMSARSGSISLGTVATRRAASCGCWTASSPSPSSATGS